MLQLAGGNLQTLGVVLILRTLTPTRLPSSYTLPVDAPMLKVAIMLHLARRCNDQGCFELIAGACCSLGSYADVTMTVYCTY